jgi:predicted phosphoadenosine phosphosulfate sulfurtransferase
MNVFEAAQQRIAYIFDEFEHIMVSFSGGKDSGVVLNMTIDEARRRGRRIGVWFIDLEAWYKKTIEFIERMIQDNSDVVDPYWVCLPMKSDNSLSYFEPFWTWWEPGKEDIWVRPMPKHPFVINLKNHKFPFYHEGITFEAFVPQMGNWYGHGEKTACLLGIRTQESLNRYRAMVMEKTTYQGRQWSTLVKNETYNFYPIYDWTVEDIWTYNGKFGKDYNHLYDLFYKAGISIHKMRVDEPFGDTCKAGLNMFKVIEPETWARVCNRVSGANMGALYNHNKMMNANYTLPKGHTWKTFTEFLLDTLPQETADHYRVKFYKFAKYWQEVGCGLPADEIKLLEEKYGDHIINTHQTNNRGKRDKEVILFRDIVDEIAELDTHSELLTWKRMAMCIIKNDYLCTRLNFSVTKDLTARQQQLVDKYRTLL